MNHDIACGFMAPRFGVGKKFQNGTDWLQLDSWPSKKKDVDQWSIGGSDHWYDVENHRVRAFNSDRTTWAVQASALRTVSNSYNMFVVESFMDEVAHALKRDPLEFRLALLNGKGGNRGIPKHRLCARNAIRLLHGSAVDLPAVANRQKLAPVRIVHCRRCAAARALPSRGRRQGRLGSKKLPPNTGMGIAVSSAEERQSPTWVAGIAEVTVDPSTGVYRINRLTIAMDPGLVVNPGGATAQIQGAALWAPVRCWRSG